MHARVNVRSLVALLSVPIIVMMMGTTSVPASGETAPAEAGSTDWQEISAGSASSCGLATTHRLYCWGSDSYGQLGDNQQHVSQRRPVQVYPFSSDWASVSVGWSHVCAVKTSGRLYCWGTSEDGALANGGRYNFTGTPVEIVGGSTKWASVSAGVWHTCAIKTTGRLYCWGVNSFGQLGSNTSGRQRHVPTEVAGASTKWRSVSAGSQRTCATKVTGRLYCWGSDDRGGLGNGGSNRSRRAPVEVAGGATNWSSVQVGGGHVCALTTTGHLYCWGDDDFGALGDNPSIGARSTPTQVAANRADWSSVSVGAAARHTCAIRTTGNLYCWGYDEVGQLGLGDVSSHHYIPTEVAGHATDWASVSTGGGHTCAVKTTGRAYCWGGAGVLGDGTDQIPSDVPVQVAPHP